MFRILLLFYSLLSACVTPRSSAVSSWKTLQAANPLTCAEWPTLQQDWEVTDLKVLPGPQPKIVATVWIPRTGDTRHFWAPYQGDVAVSSEDLQGIKNINGAPILGMGEVGGTPFALTAHGDGKGKSVIEFRRFSTTSTVQNVLTLPGSIKAGDALTRQGDVWFAYQLAQGESGEIGNAVDETFGLSLLHQENHHLVGRPVEALKLPKLPTLVQGPQGVAAVWLADRGNGNGINGKAASFMVQSINHGLVIGSPLRLPLTIKDRIESWAAASDGNYLYLAYVEGDSLIGSSALRMVRFDRYTTNPRALTQVSYPVKGEHASTPAWLQTPVGMRVLLSKWVDSESTIASYPLQTKGVAAMHGVLPSGTTIASAFYDRASRSSIVVVSYLTEDMGLSHRHFELCRLGK